MVTTITTTAGDDARIAPAFGAYLGLGTGNNANAAQVKAAVAAWVVQIVRNYETQQAANTASAAAPVSPT